jgi:hypothetical protein
LTDARTLAASKEFDTFRSRWVVFSMRAPHLIYAYRAVANRLAAAIALIPLVATAAVLAVASPANAACTVVPLGWGGYPGLTKCWRTSGEVGTASYDGSRYVSLASTQSGGSIYQDYNVTVSTGHTYCATAQFVTEGAATGGGGDFRIWLLGGTLESSARTLTNLPNASNWTPASSCVTATSAHSAVRVEFYPTVNGPAVGMDSVDLHYSAARNGGFNTGFAHWSTHPASTGTVHGPGVTGNDPYEGVGFAATSTSVAGGGIYQDIAISLPQNKTLCATAKLVTRGSSPGAGGTFQLSLPESPTAFSQRHFTNLPGGNGWTEVTTCVTSPAFVTSVRVEIKPLANGPAIAVDSVDVHQSWFNGAFNTGTGSWSTYAPTTLTFHGPAVTGNDPYEGSRFAAATAGGSMYKDISLAAGAAASYCASARVATLGAGSGASVTLALWDLNTPNTPRQVSLKAMGNLAGGNSWALVSACGSMGSATTGRAELYVANASVAVDAFDVHSTLVYNPGFNTFLPS